jgi:hypothetical protein
MRPGNAAAGSFFSLAALSGSTAALVCFARHWWKAHTYLQKAHISDVITAAAMFACSAAIMVVQQLCLPVQQP